MMPLAPSQSVRRLPVPESSSPSLGRLLLALALVFQILPSSSAAASPATPPSFPPVETMVRYHVSFPELLAHRVQVSMSLDALDGGPVEIAMPVWSPGSYLVREYARHVLDLTAHSDDGTLLATEKIAKNVWRIHADGARSLHVDYALYANELSVRTNEVNADHAFLQSAGTFFRYPAAADGPHQVSFDVPPGWGVFTPLPRQPAGWIAEDYDELADSPFELGPHQQLEFEVNGVPHQIVLAGESAVDQEQLQQDVSTICQEVSSIFGSMPFDHYTFLFLLVDAGGGGLEHKNSSVCMSNRWELIKTKNYRRFLSLVAHEYFHAWNVKRFRPQALGPFDYDVENYTPDLWVAEGITSYFDDLSTVRAGFTDKIKTYLDDRAASFRSEAERPGALRTSLTESSFDAWIKLYRPDENSTNSTVSYYSKGALVAFMLDLRIRRLTRGERGLAEVLRLGWTRYTANGQGYPPGALATLASEVAGSDLADFFDDYVRGTAPLEPDDDLAWLGLALTVEPETSERRLPVDDDGYALEPWLGISTRSKDGLVGIDTVLEGSPAFRAGLNHDDLILAIDRMRVSPSTFSDRLDRTAGKEIRLTFWRGQELREITLTPDLRRLSTWSLASLPEVSEDQLMAFHDWCGWDHPSIASQGDEADHDEAEAHARG